MSAQANEWRGGNDRKKMLWIWLIIMCPISGVFQMGSKDKKTYHLLNFYFHETNCNYFIFESQFFRRMDGIVDRNMDGWTDR